MKALVLKEYNNLVYEEVAKPELRADEVLVEVKACGICGSDVHGMDGSTGRRLPPIIMGHEAAGVIAKVGAEVTGRDTGLQSVLQPNREVYGNLQVRNRGTYHFPCRRWR